MPCPSCGAPVYNTELCLMCYADIRQMKEMIRKGIGIPKCRLPINRW